VLAAQYLRPDRRLYGFDAHGAPERWRAYLDWLFDFRLAPDGTVSEALSLRAFRTTTGADYVVLSAPHRPIDGLRDLLEGLDDLGATVVVWRDRPFVRWLDEAALERSAEGAP
jgi:hypothetical protein